MSDEREAVLAAAKAFALATYLESEESGPDARLDALTAALDAALLAAWLEGHASGCSGCYITVNPTEIIAQRHCPEAQERIDAAAPLARRKD